MSDQEIIEDVADAIGEFTVIGEGLAGVHAGIKTLGLRSWALSAILARIGNAGMARIARGLSTEEIHRLQLVIESYRPDVKARDAQMDEIIREIDPPSPTEKS